MTTEAQPAGEPTPEEAIPAGATTDEAAFDAAADAIDAEDAAAEKATKEEIAENAEAAGGNPAPADKAKKEPAAPAPDADDENDPAFKRLAETSGRAKKDAPAPAPADKPDEQPPPERKPDPAPRKPAPAAKTDPGEPVKLKWKDPDTDSDVEMTADEWEKQFPDFAGYVGHKARALASETIAQMRESGEIADASVVQHLQTELVRLQFDVGISRSHPDWREHADPKSDFRTKWLEGRPAEDKKLFTDGGVRGAVALLDAYKAHRAKAEKRAAAAKAAAEADKGRRDGLHGDSLSGASRIPDAASADAADMFDKESARLEAEERGTRRR
jgi:hypothetical protein